MRLMPVHVFVAAVVENVQVEVGVEEDRVREVPGAAEETLTTVSVVCPFL